MASRFGMVVLIAWGRWRMQRCHGGNASTLREVSRRAMSWRRRRRQRPARWCSTLRSWRRRGRPLTNGGGSARSARAHGAGAPGRRGAEHRSVAVTDKTQTPPSGDKHDYLSQAPYEWASKDRRPCEQPRGLMVAYVMRCTAHPPTISDSSAWFASSVASSTPTRTALTEVVMLVAARRVCVCRHRPRTGAQRPRRPAHQLRERRALPAALPPPLVSACRVAANCAASSTTVLGVAVAAAASSSPCATLPAVSTRSPPSTPLHPATVPRPMRTPPES